MDSKEVLSKEKMKQSWRKIEKYTAKKSVRNRESLAGGQERGA